MCKTELWPFLTILGTHMRALSWAEIHLAPNVWICKTYGTKRLAGYLIQYLASQEGETRMSWSWGWVYRGFVHNWDEVKRDSRDIKEAIEVWDWHPHDNHGRLNMV
jgi:hypothetical protein